MPFSVFPVITEENVEPRLFPIGWHVVAYSFYVNNMLQSRVRRFCSIDAHLRLFKAVGGYTYKK